MALLRHPIGQKIVAWGFILTLLPTWIVALPLHSIAESDASVWLRTALHAPATPAIDAAFAVAEAESPETKTAFLRVFIEAFHAQQTGEHLADYFVLSSLIPFGLLDHLPYRLMEAPPPPQTGHLWMTTARAVSPNLTRQVAALWRVIPVLSQAPSATVLDLPPPTLHFTTTTLGHARVPRAP